MRRIHHEQARAPLFMLEAVQPDPARAADLASQLLGPRALLDVSPYLGQLFALDVLEASAGKCIGPFERRANLVEVRQVSLQVRVAPWSPWRRPRFLGLRRR